MTEQEPDARELYADIIHLPHWRSPTRPHMSLYDRAAQFASYKALSGYEDMVLEEARTTEREVQLEGAALEELNEKLTLLSETLAEGVNPTLTFTVFVPDERKAGGRYVKLTDTVKRLDPTLREIVLTSRTPAGTPKTIPFASLTDVEMGIG